MPSTPADETVPPRTEKCPRLTQGERCTQVLQAAIRLFAEKGFQGTKTKEIAEAAGINEALIFRDFQSKEKLYCAILDYAAGRIKAERWLEDVAPYAAARNDEALFTNLAIKFFESFGRERALFRLMMYSALEQHELARKFRERQIEPVERFIEDYIAARQQEGAFRNAVPHSLARCFLSMCHNRVLRQTLFGDAVEPATDAEAARTFTEVLLDGVRSR